MAKTGVFISYSHENKELRNEIIERLNADNNIEVYYDEKNIQAGSLIHESISAMLDSSYIVVAIITQAWLTGVETREEFTRAHERKKHLICFAEGGQHLETLPQFTKDALQIRFTWNAKAKALDNLVSAIQQIVQNKISPKHIIYKRLREIGNEIQKSDTAFYRLNLAYDHIEHALKETKNILGSGDYSIDIGNETGYLLKAISIFESASNIYAVSMTGISTFWDDRKHESKAIQYLNKQSEEKIKIIRLFVFSNCTQVNEYKNILQANHLAYGDSDKGAVLMCGKRTYERFLDKIMRSNQFKDIFNDDFGILSYIDMDKNEEHFIEARLDNNLFKFSPIFINHINETGTKRFIDKFKEIDENLTYGDFLDDYKIMRWDPKFLQDPDLFAEKIKSLFEEYDDLESITHLAVFKNCESSHVEEGLYELVNRLKTMNGKAFHFNKIELLTNTKTHAFDNKFGTRLPSNEEINYIIKIEFKNEKDLKDYYSHAEHSKERETIYAIVNPSIAEYYNKVAQLPRDAQYKRNAGEIYDRIEQLMTENFFRLDIRNFEIPELIVHQKGIPFGKFIH